MPQQSKAYAVGRVSVLLREKLDTAAMERLLSAGTLSDALRVLQDMGLQDQQTEDYERVAWEHMHKACAFLREVSPEPRITNCFLIRFDVHNLKTLLKARCLSQSAENLSDCGVFPVEQLRHAVEERRYRMLPPSLQETLDALEKRLAVREDPLDIDVSLDKAMYHWIFDSLAEERSSTVYAYFVARVDLQCALMLLRSQKMGKSSSFFEQLLLPGGKIPKAKWLEAYEQPRRLPELVRPYGLKVAQTAQAAVEQGALPALEKAIDDALLAMFAPWRQNPLTIEPLIAYVLLREREASAIRLILAAKVNGFSPEAVRERLRELYA